MNQTVLKEKLHKVTNWSSIWSRKNGTTFRTLQGTLNSIFNKTKDLNGTIPYSTLARRMTGGKLGVTKGSQRIDMCEVCCTYDKKVVPSVQKTLANAARMKELVPDFFEGFELMPVNATPCLEYMTRLKAFIEAEHAGIDDLGPDEKNKIAELQTLASEELGELIAMLPAHHLHFQIRDCQRTAFTNDLLHPKEKYIYMAWDLEEV